MENKEYIIEMIHDILINSKVKKEDIDNIFDYFSLVYQYVEYHPNIAYVGSPIGRELFNFFIIDLERCRFLAKIPRDDWEINIYKILRWGQKYFREPIFEKGHNRRDAKPERDANVQALIKAREIFIPEKINEIINQQGTTMVEYEGTPFQDNLFIDELHNKLSKAIEDIKEEKFNIFPREYYFGSKESKKYELEKILKNIAIAYSISPYSDDIKHIRELIEKRSEQVK